jgi:hypothetical protein
MTASKKSGKATEGGGGIFISGKVRDFHGDLAGRDMKKTVTNAQPEMKKAYGDITQAISSASPEVKKQATDKLNDLKKEVDKGKKSDDGVMSRLVKGLVDLVPGATKAVVGAFTTPLLGAIAGPLTKEVIKKLEHLGNEHHPQEPPDKPQAI